MCLLLVVSWSGVLWVYIFVMLMISEIVLLTLAPSFPSLQLFPTTYVHMKLSCVNQWHSDTVTQWHSDTVTQCTCKLLTRIWSCRNTQTGWLTSVTISLHRFYSGVRGSQPPPLPHGKNRCTYNYSLRLYWSIVNFDYWCRTLGFKIMISTQQLH